LQLQIKQAQNRITLHKTPIIIISIDW